MQIPEDIAHYFWDTDPQSLDPDTHKTHIIERVLEYGDDNATEWLFDTYEKDTIAEVLRKSRRISPRTGALYAVLLEIPKEELECFQKPFTQKQERF